MLQLGRSLPGDRHWVIPAGSELLQAPKPPTNNWLTSLLFCKCQQQSSGKISSLPPSCNALADMRQQIKIGRLKLALTRLLRAAGHKYNHPDFACYKTEGWDLCPFTHLLWSKSDVPDLASRILQVFISVASTHLSSLPQDHRALSLKCTGAALEAAKGQVFESWTINPDPQLTIEICGFAFQHNQDAKNWSVF